MKNLQAFCKRAHFCGFTSVMQLRVFLAVGDFPGETTARRVGDAIGVEPSQVSSVMRFLSDWQLVQLETRVEMVDGRNCRRVYIRMTALGRTSLDMLEMEVAR